MPIDCSSLEKYRHRTPVRIPKGFPTAIFQSEYTQAELKALCSFFSLKVAFESSVITNYKKKYQDLAKYLDCKQSSLRTRLMFLQKLGLITKDIQIIKGKKIPYLYLVSYIKAKDILKNYIPGYINPKNKRQNTINYPIKNNKHLYETLQSVAINENFLKQKYKVLQYILNKEAQKIGVEQIGNARISGGHKKERKRLRQNILNHFPYYCYKYMRDKYSLLCQNDSSQNTDITLSCKGISNLFNKKSTQTGHLILNKLQSQNLLQTKKREIILERYKNQSYQQFSLIKESLPVSTQHRMIYKYGRIFLKLSNKITLNTDKIFVTNEVKIPEIFNSKKTIKKVNSLKSKMNSCIYATDINFIKPNFINSNLFLLKEEVLLQPSL